MYNFPTSPHFRKSAAGWLVELASRAPWLAWDLYFCEGISAYNSINSINFKLTLDKNHFYWPKFQRKWKTFS